MLFFIVWSSASRHFSFCLVTRYSCGRFTHVSSEPHSNKSLSSSPISDWLVARRLSVISITMATTSSDTDGTRRHANTQYMIDKSGFSAGFLESKGKKREFFDQANKSLSNGVGCWMLSWLSFSIWKKKIKMFEFNKLKKHDDDWILQVQNMHFSLQWPRDFHGLLYTLYYYSNNLGCVRYVQCMVLPEATRLTRTRTHKWVWSHSQS